MRTNLPFNYGLFEFGISIEPVARANASAIEFVNVHTNCGGRIGYSFYCKKCNNPTRKEDLQKGYVVGGGKGGNIALFTQDELKAFETNKGIMTLGLTKDINPESARIKGVYSLDISTEKKTTANNKVRYAVIANGLKKNNVAIKAIVKFNSRGIKSAGEFGIIRYNAITNKMEFIALFYKEEMLPINKLEDSGLSQDMLDKATDNLFAKEITMTTSIDDVVETHVDKILATVSERIKAPQQVGMLKKEAKTEEEKLLMSLAGV